MIALLLLISQDPMMARAREMTAAEQRCVPNTSTTDITICGLRRADRFRLPFVVHDAGDPRHESVQAERVRLLNRTNPVQDMGPFQVESGMTGMSVGTGGVTLGGKRKLAP